MRPIVSVQGRSEAKRESQKSKLASHKAKFAASAGVVNRRWSDYSRRQFANAAMQTRPKVKICCIKSAEEAALAISCGASAVGLVSAMPSGPGVISEDAIAQIAATVPPPIATFLLTCECSPDAIIAQQRRCGTNTVQLCDHLPPTIYPRLREGLPGVRLVQVVHVIDDASVDYAIAAAAHVDALLLDSGNLSLAIRQLGGTGRTHDWTLSRRIRDNVSIPIYLAGGLNPGNVAAAIAAVDPFGLDLCSSVRTNDDLDPIKLRAFFTAIPSADNANA
ncbi:MAG: Phosphoribosylanthranilate isomerase [Verrucomicrobiales bacterium]|nr:Phosphoribosylanthranilate isomerase [Verrucomicrobiales bacterium]